MKKALLKLVTHVLVPAAILVVIILVAGNTEVFDSVGGIKLNVTLSLAKVLKVLMALAVVFMVSNLILLLLGIFRNKSGRTGTLATVTSSLIKYAAVLVAFCWVLSIIGVNVSTIFASVGIVALILGFGAESLVADLVTGVFILFENQYNVGDIIEVDGFRGKVTEIGIRTICIEDTGHNVKIINNADLKNIVNRSNQRSVAVCDVSISYDTDMEQFEEEIAQILKKIKDRNPNMFIDRVEFIGVEQLADSGVVVRIIADVEEENIFKGRRLLNKELKIEFDKANITIPYPQVDVHSK